MTLQDLLTSFPQVHLAEPRDDDRIRHFFHTRPMDSKNFFLSYERNPSFFDFLKLQGHAYFVFYVENESGQIEGCGSLSLRHGQHHGRSCLIGYLADLRVSNIRRWGRVWRDFYEALITEAARIQELAQVKLFYTCLLIDNKKAYNSLVLNKTNLSYTHFHNYKMINVFSVLMPVVVKEIQVKSWDEVSLSELKEFYRRNSAKVPYAYTYEQQHNELDRRISSFPDFTLNHGVVLMRNNQIIAACSFWSPTSCKKIIMYNQTRKMLLLGQLMCLPKNQEELKCLYLLGLQLDVNLADQDKMQLMKVILSFALKRAKKYGFHCVSFAHFQTSIKFNLFPYFIAHSTDLAMYVVHPKNETAHLKLERSNPPAFEIGLI
jgi:hypothetical protein